MKKTSDLIAKPRSLTTRKRRPTTADSEVGESIRAHRLLAGMSQEDLAKKLGVSFQQVQKYEKGTNRVGAGRLPLIAEILNIPVGNFFSGSVVGVGGAVPTKLVTDTASIRLLTAFQQISDRAIRRNLSELAERVASAAKKKMRR
jgi:transcriptional regulator with XRE-family HTH domain